MKRNSALYPLFPAFCLIILILSSCENDKNDSSSLKKVHIGIYSDNGAGGVAEIESMLNQLGCFYTSVNKDTILTARLSNYDILLFPGGDMWVYKSHLTIAGVQKINDFVRDGGGYIGICAGSYFAADRIVWRGWADESRKYLTFTGLGLFRGTADGPIEDFAPLYQDSYCKVKINKNHIITADTPQQVDYLYSFGPKYIIADSSNITTLGRSNTGNYPVVLAVQFEKGRVFLTALHPEFDNDKTSWDMIKKAVLWCSNKL